ncbi:hypothetical protein [Streptomyces sp. NPDC054838]
MERWQQAGVFDQLPPDLRWTRHPAQSHHDRGQRQRGHQDPRPGRRHPIGGGRPSRPRRPEALLGDKGYDSNPNRDDELRKRRVLPVTSRKGAPNIKDIGKLRYVVEQTFVLLHHFKRLAIRRERRTEPSPSSAAFLLETPEQAQLMIELRALTVRHGTDEH